jgi:hypothetical protein
MKRITLTLMIAVLATGIYSCKKSDSTTTTNDAVDKLIGNWAGQDTSQVGWGGPVINIASTFKKISSTEVYLLAFEFSDDSARLTVGSNGSLVQTWHNHASSFIFNKVSDTKYTFKNSFSPNAADGYLIKQ